MTWAKYDNYSGRNKEVETRPVQTLLPFLIICLFSIQKIILTVIKTLPTSMSLKKNFRQWICLHAKSRIETILKSFFFFNEKNSSYFWENPFM